jgi:peptide/nickel transport system substrate-binding protein
MPTITTMAAIFDGLTRLDRDGNAQPALAISWRNIDPLTWEFTLRENVIFSNGASLTADAVVNAVTYLAGDGPPFENTRREMTFFASAQAIDELTVIINTTEPMPLLPRFMSSLLIPEPGAWRSLGREGFTQAPVGTGPFKVESWQPSKITLTAFKKSWRPPLMERLEIVPIPDPTARVQGLLSGRLDVITDIGPDEKASVERFGGTGLSWFSGAVQGISLAVTRPGPFQDVRVRQALNLAVNRQRIIDALLAGSTVVAFQPAPRGTIGYNPDLQPYPYDPDRAKALLASAGYPDGFSFVMETTNTGGGSADVYQQVASDLQSVGVNMEIRVLATPRFMRNIIQTGEYADAIHMVWPAWPVQDSALVFKFHSCLHHVAWYCDESIMPKIKTALVEWDPDKAVALRQEVMSYYHEQAPAIFLFEQVMSAGLAPGTSGFENIFGFIHYENIKVTD